MNLIEQSERLKGAPDAFLQQEAQAPSGFAPPYLILAEIGRRQSLRQRGAATKAPQTTVYDDLTGQAGLPTMEALGRPGASPMPAMPAAQRPAVQQGPPPTGLAAAVPMRMQRGGIVRMALGGGIYGSPTGGYDYPFLREAMDRQRMEEEERKRQMLLARANPPNLPSTTMVRGIPFPAVPAPAQRNLPPLVAPTIKEPALSPVLEEIRGLRTPASELTAPLEQRIAELEQQRKTIERPTLKSALFETGLGMMASRAPTALGALGQAGIGALQNYRARQQQARAEEQDIAKQIGATGAQIAGTRSRQEEQLFDDAMRRMQQLHGAEVVRAQTEDTTQRANRREQEEALDRADRFAQQQYGQQYGVALEQLQRELRQPTPVEREQNWQDYVRKQDYETKKNIEQGKALYHPPAGASGPSAIERRLLQQGSIDRQAKSLIMEQLRQGWVDPKLSPGAAKEQAQAAVLENLKKFYPGMSNAERELLRESVGSFTANKDFLEEVRGIQGARRAAPSPGQTPAVVTPPVDDLGYKPSSSKAVRELSLTAPSTVKAASAPVVPAAPVAVFAQPPWDTTRRDIPMPGLRVDAQGMPPAAARVGGLAPDAGQKLMEHFGGADPDDPAKAYLFQGYSPEVIKAYREYRSGPGRQIRYR